MPYTLEVCVDSTASALAAKRGGADRLELCADLVIGGTTPSLALLRQVKAETGLPVRALLRPRFGDFCYDHYELAQMEQSAAELVEAGADGIVTGIVAFGINSGAYVAEIFRSGIMSIYPGQMEAGRSLGFNYAQTMWYVIMPQAFKTVLPTLCNEFISLLKETSVSGYIAIQDLTKGGDIIRSRTYSAFMPLIAVALVYLVIVMIFTKLIQILERRLRQSER